MATPALNHVATDGMTVKARTLGVQSISGSSRRLLSVRGFEDLAIGAPDSKRHGVDPHRCVLWLQLPA